jgi:hypothetical protein
MSTTITTSEERKIALMSMSIAFNVVSILIIHKYLPDILCNIVEYILDVIGCGVIHKRSEWKTMDNKKKLNKKIVYKSLNACDSYDITSTRPFSNSVEYLSVDPDDHTMLYINGVESTGLFFSPVKLIIKAFNPFSKIVSVVFKTVKFLLCCWIVERISGKLTGSRKFTSSSKSSELHDISERKTVNSLNYSSNRYRQRIHLESTIMLVKFVLNVGVFVFYSLISVFHFVGIDKLINILCTYGILTVLISLLKQSAINNMSCAIHIWNSGMFASGDIIKHGGVLHRIVKMDFSFVMITPEIVYNVNTMGCTGVELDKQEFIAMSNSENRENVDYYIEMCCINYSELINASKIIPIKNIEEIY